MATPAASATFTAQHLNKMKAAALDVADPETHATSLVGGHVASAAYQAEHNRIVVTLKDGTGFPLPLSG